MASEFLVDGDLFVEVVDNNDGDGIPSKHLAAHIGTAPLTRPLSHLSVLTAITVYADSTAEKDRCSVEIKRLAFRSRGAQCA